jgi:hypothetical protein
MQSIRELTENLKDEILTKEMGPALARLDLILANEGLELEADSYQGILEGIEEALPQLSPEARQQVEAIGDFVRKAAHGAGKAIGFVKGKVKAAKKFKRSVGAAFHGGQKAGMKRGFQGKPKKPVGTPKGTKPLARKPKMVRRPMAKKPMGKKPMPPKKPMGKKKHLKLVASNDIPSNDIAE